MLANRDKTDLRCIVNVKGKKHGVDDYQYFVHPVMRLSGHPTDVQIISRII